MKCRRRSGMRSPDRNAKTRYDRSTMSKWSTSPIMRWLRRPYANPGTARCSRNSRSVTPSCSAIRSSESSPTNQSGASCPAATSSSFRLRESSQPTYDSRRGFRNSKSTSGCDSSIAAVSSVLPSSSATTASAKCDTDANHSSSSPAALRAGSMQTTRMPYSAVPVRILLVTDGLEPLLARTFVGLADRGHEVRVVGALSVDELDAVDRFRLGAAFRVVEKAQERSGGNLSMHAARVARAATSDPRALKAVVDRTRRAHGLGRQFRDRMRACLPMLEAPADVVYFEAANVAAEHAAILDQLPPKVVMCTGSDVRVMPDRSPWLARALPGVFAAMSRIVCRSQDLRDWAERRGAPPGRTTVLYPAV